MPTCRICAHPHRPAIEAALQAGTSQRQIAAQFGVGKSTLGRHVPHVTQVQAGAAPVGVRCSASPAVAPALDPPPMTTAAATEQLTRLQQRHQDATFQLETTQAALSQASERHVQAVWTEREVLSAQQARDAAQQAVAAAEEQMTLLAQGIQEAERTRRATEESWQAQQRAHWQVVLTHLHDPYEIWVTRIAAQHVWVPHPDGRRPYPGEQEPYWAAVQARFPCVEGAPPLAPAAPQDLPRRRAIALQPFAYGDQALRAGEVFDLVGSPNDDVLLKMHYCRQLREEVTHG